MSRPRRSTVVDRILERAFGRRDPDLIPLPDMSGIVEDPPPDPPPDPGTTGPLIMPDMGDLIPGDPPPGPAPPSIEAAPDLGDLDKGWVVVDLGEFETVQTALPPRGWRRGSPSTADVRRKERYGVKRVTEVRPSDSVIGDYMSYEEASGAVDALNGVLRDVMES